MIHNTKFAQFIPPTDVHLVTGTWTMIAGQVAGTIVLHKAATAETTIVTIPIVIPSNSVALNGSKLSSIEIDYEVLVAACTTVTAVINKVARGIEGAVAVVAAQTFTQSPTAANSALVEQHKLVLTITTPFWVDNDEYVLVQLTMVAAATTQIDILGAVANYTFRA